MGKVTFLCLLLLSACVFESAESRRSRKKRKNLFDLLDLEIAKDLDHGADRKLHRSGSPDAVTGPRNNKYLDASIQVVKGMSEAEGLRRRIHEQRMIDATVAASNDKNIPKARKMVGYLLHGQLKNAAECHCPPEQGPCPNLPSRCTRPTKPNEHETIFKKLRKALGNEGFETLMGINGDVSLIFALDTSGTMQDEIEAAKNISKAIAAFPRDGHVNYILSPFSDPTWGNVYKCSSQEKFADALDLLRAERGGDCPELTFHGVVDAIEIGEPHVGSPMFVFTDAGVKELPSTKYNLDNAIGLAVDYRIPVNVFYSEESGSCGSYNSHDSLVRLVDESYGFGLRFNSFGEIQKAGALVSAALNGMTAITEGRWLGSDVGRRPRSVGSVGAWKSYIIPVDETVEDLIVAFSAERASHLVELRDSKETPAPVTERLDKGALWIVNSPARGVWRLVVPLEVGTHTFKVKSSSNFNLEFDYLFVLSGGKNREYPIEHPLIGEPAIVKLIVPSSKLLERGSLALSLVSETGADLANAVLSESNLSATFIAPDQPFKFKLSGRLVGSGTPFQRLSRTLIKAKNAVLRIQRGLEYTTMVCNSALKIHFALHYNGNPGQTFKVTVNSSSAAIHENTVYPSVVQNTLRQRKIYFSVTFRVPSEGVENDEWNTFKVTATKAGSEDERDATSYTDHLRIKCDRLGSVP